MNKLEELGFNRGLTSTEYVLNIIDNFLKITDNRDFTRKFLETYNRVIRERPSNSASINILRKIGEYIISNGFSNIDDFLIKMRENILKSCRESAIVASNRVVDNDIIITNSNSLCMKYLFKQLVDNSIKYKVFVAESRPGMESFDLINYLDELGVETYFIIDSAMRFFVKKVSKVIVSSESIAINGAVVSKIGTSLLSLIAKESRIRVFVIAPLYKLGFETIYGELLRLPEGDWRLLMNESIRRELPENYVARVPLFDVTPPEYIDGLATENGLFAPQAIPAVLKQVYGMFPPIVKPINEIISKIKEMYEKGVFH
uniref:Initiation factor 2B n=1 Tax=Staphylothermus marinus TaxID=2280 RepID=A0A7C4HGE3_STAMA